MISQMCPHAERECPRKLKTIKTIGEVVLWRSGKDSLALYLLLPPENFHLPLRPRLHPCRI